MNDEFDLIARLERANTEELTQLLANPTTQEERVLRAYLGDECYHRQHSLALKLHTRREKGFHAPFRGNVVVIHGLLGAELSSIERATGQHERIWLNPRRVIAGQLARLRLAPDGLTPADPAYAIEPSGIMKRYYGELLLTLAQYWQVRAFWYDWRKDINIAAAELAARIKGWFGETEPVHLVAHAMGGLVARSYIQANPQRWQAGGRLILLGSPDHGTFVALQVLTGLAPAVERITRLDQQNNREAICAMITSFVSLYQLLPSPLVDDQKYAPLYDSSTYGSRLTLVSEHLEHARSFHAGLGDISDPKRVVSIAGCFQPTYVDVKIGSLRNPKLTSYDVSLDGDGIVPHRFGLLGSPDAAAAAVYYVVDQNANLPTNSRVLTCLDELLGTGETANLSPSAAAALSPEARTKPFFAEPQSSTDLARVLSDIHVLESSTLDRLTRRMRTRREPILGAGRITAEDREIEEILTRHILDHRAPSPLEQHPAPPIAPAKIHINIMLGDISRVDELRISGPPVDAIAVGHYIGGQPSAAMRALDESMSTALLRQLYGEHWDGVLRPGDRLLAQYADRGVLRGELAKPFFLNDPRAKKGVQRIIAVAGMGLPGRFGLPELTVLASELCWSLGRQGKHHLATVLFGVGSIGDTMTAWIRGIKRAVTGSSDEDLFRLKSITIVEQDPERLIEMDEALIYEKNRLEARQRLIIDYRGLTEAEIKRLRASAKRFRAWRYAELEGRASTDRVAEPLPTRITVSLSGEQYRFGAITETASIPEREILLDSRLVLEANDELAAEFNRDRQLELGQFLGQLLIPEDLRRILFTGAPIVMIVDSQTARIHWELIAQSELGNPQFQHERMGVAQTDPKQFFLGISRGFTRQLQTTTAPLPEPPLARARMLRALVVADPAEDARLPGAEEEGNAVAELFERFNTLYEQSHNRIEVKCLLGPREATRTAVLRELMLHSYDILHFAGHCIYNPNDGVGSGWVFNARNNEYLTARELTRIDRIPKFVFSNACESGVTTGPSADRSVDLAPNFAESFFARGVANFVCTAWPIDDDAAREFALMLYARLLGIRLAAANQYTADRPCPMYVAMREARLAIADDHNDVHTWGAYQHYGNPYFRMLDPTALEQSRG